MKQICAAFGVPADTGMDSANVPAQHRCENHSGRIPLPAIIDPMVAALNLSLTPDFGNIETLRIVPDYSNIEALQEGFRGEQRSESSGSWGYPINAINQRLELGMDDVGGRGYGLYSVRNDSGRTGYFEQGTANAAIIRGSVWRAGR